MLRHVIHRILTLVSCMYCNLQTRRALFNITFRLSEHCLCDPDTRQSDPGPIKHSLDISKVGSVLVVYIMLTNEVSKSLFHPIIIHLPHKTLAD